MIRKGTSGASGVEQISLKKPDAKLEECIRGFRAIALVSVLAKWYAAVVVGLLHEVRSRLNGRSGMLVPGGVSTVSKFGRY